MTFYMVRHKVTKEWMPDSRRIRDMPKKVLAVPKLFLSMDNAYRSIYARERRDEKKVITQDDYEVVEVSVEVVNDLYPSRQL